MNNPRQNLIRILQNAHAGELAAAFAYRGHWKSLRESAEKTQIKKLKNGFRFNEIRDKKNIKFPILTNRKIKK